MAFSEFWLILVSVGRPRGPSSEHTSGQMSDSFHGGTSLRMMCRRPELADHAGDSQHPESKWGGDRSQG